MSIIYKAGFVGRQNFGHLLNHHRLLGSAVEVGTHQGLFAEQLLTWWIGKKLYCVDPYTPNYDPTDRSALGDRDYDRRQAEKCLLRFEGRYEFITEESIVASSRWGDSPLDFVYVDGNHQPEHVAADLRAWWPLIRPGGILAGHDIVTSEPDGGWGRFIQPVVSAFACTIPAPVYLVPESDGSAWSFFIIKEQP